MENERKGTKDGEAKKKAVAAKRSGKSGKGKKGKGKVIMDFREKPDIRMSMDGLLKTKRHSWKITSQLAAGDMSDVMEVYMPKKPSKTGLETGAAPKRTMVRTYALKVAKRAKGRRREETLSHMLTEMRVLVCIQQGGRFEGGAPPKLTSFFPRIFDFGNIDESEGYGGYISQQRIEEQAVQEKEKVIIRPDFKMDPLPFIIVEKMTLTLEELMAAAPLRKMGRRVSLALGIACYKALNALHDLGFIHRNVQPRSFAIRTTRGFRPDSWNNSDNELKVLNLHQVVVCDLGTASCWPEELDKARPDEFEFKGSVLYASPNTHEGRRPGPIDDLWSLQYMLTEWLTAPAELPWAKCKVTKGAPGSGPVKRAVKLSLLYTATGFLHEMSKAHRELKAIDSVSRPSPIQVLPHYLKAQVSAFQAAAAAEGGLKTPGWLPFVFDDNFSHNFFDPKPPTIANEEDLD